MGLSSARYHRYWGKAGGEIGDDVQPCHLLVYHCLDVAAVAARILENDSGLVDRLASALGMTAEELVRFLIFSNAIHDIGKFARAFQGLALPKGIDLVPPLASITYDARLGRHDALGAMAWKRSVLPHFERSGGLHFPPGQSRGLTLSTSLSLWFGCFFGHHGKPVQESSNDWSLWFTQEDLEAVWDFVSDVAELLKPSWPLRQLQDSDWRDEVFPAVSWQIAGFSTLCDWLGSDQSIFKYVTEPIPLETYWHQYAMPRALKAIEGAGFDKRATVAAFTGFKSAFGFEPTPLQSWSECTPIDSGPQLFLLEDITGSGKTEAALTLAHRLLVEGAAEGLYFGLPTQATSNAMYERLATVYRRFYGQADTPSLVLAHGARHLSETFQRSMRTMVSETIPDVPYKVNADTSASIECREWLADNRKKAFLAEVGVGTLDQALLAILPRRHQSLRLLGLVGKVLIADEVHAYDTYTATLLQRLLEAHARLGGSAILLSATIPSMLRKKFVLAWQRGRGGEQTELSSDQPFPLATHVHDAGLLENPVEAAQATCRDLPVEFVDEEDDAIARLVAAANAGSCACWIRNTVDDAIRAYSELVGRLPNSENAMLFHARYIMADRQHLEMEALRRFGKHSTSEERRGAVLIATQVVEQSLDLDFDVLVSDLAPVDLLIQRAGRVHRHRRDSAGNRCSDVADDGRDVPVLTVLAPRWTNKPSSEWLKNLLPATPYVYDDIDRLWLTQKVLREVGSIRLPEAARSLLEAVYDPDDIPEGLQPASLESYATGRVQASGALFNALALDEGYVLDSGIWSDDQEIGTRLSDQPTWRVALLRVDESGALAPWVTNSQHPWDMSSVNLRQNQVEHLPALPKQFEEQAEALRQRYRRLRYTVFWLPEAGGGTWGYDSERGAGPAKAGNKGP